MRAVFTVIPQEQSHRKDMAMNNTTSSVIREVRREDGGAKYLYRLRVTRSNRVASYHIPLYSVDVEMDYEGKHTESSVNDVFADVGKALVFFNTLVEYLATPIDLPYILEDKISGL